MSDTSGTIGKEGAESCIVRKEGHPQRGEGSGNPTWESSVQLKPGPQFPQEMRQDKPVGRNEETKPGGAVDLDTNVTVTSIKISEGWQPEHAHKVL